MAEHGVRRKRCRGGVGLLGLALLAAPPGVLAERPFAECVSDLQQDALQAGIGEAIVTGVLAEVERLDRVIELDRRQPEFTSTFSDYYGRRVTPARVERGRALLKEHAATLAEVEKQYGVPAHYLLAFWGLETNFGGYFGKIRVPDALATLACDPRRSDFFRQELFAALRIIEAGDITREKMLGSWAGAMGHVQFMPSAFLGYAVDGDGDGRRDLWTSVPDAMASAGNFLRELGWKHGFRWGREVRLPETFDYSLAGRDQARLLSEWVELGVRTAGGGPIPPLAEKGSILVPSGHKGPAFLVYDNFDVIMRWNRSEYYAIAVGRLADEIAGRAGLQRPPPPDAAPIATADVLQLQRDLDRLGYDVGEPDGIFGPVTRRALASFQKSRNLVADGHLDADAFQAVREALPL